MGPIGLIYKLVKKELDKRKQRQQTAGDQTPGQDAVPSSARASQPAAAAEDDAGFKGPIGMAVEFVQKKLDKGQAPANEHDGFDSVPLDEEGFGKGASPAQAGIPRDPQHARSKRLALMALMTMGFGLAIDFSMSLMSIQPLYYVLQGPEHVYGLTFGAYDLTATIFAPLFGYWTDHTHTFRIQIIFGAVVNAIGNLLYGFVYLADAWWLMLVSRAVAGVGAATLGIGSSYITQTTTSARRQVVLGRYRVTQNMARMAGPFVGYLFIGLPNVNSGSSDGLKLFNWYTIPGWAAFVLVAVLVTVFVWWFVDPTDENEHRVHAEDAAVLGPPTAERIAQFRNFVVAWLLLSFLAILSFSGYTSNLFALFAGQFHGVNSQGDNWRTYIGMGIGAVVGAWSFRKLIRWVPRLWEERKLCVVSNALLFATWMLVIPYKGSTYVPSDVLFYASTGLAGFTVVVNQASLETVFSKKVTQYADVVGDHVGKYMGAFFMAASAGRFAGALLVASVTRIATPSGQTNFCTNWMADTSGTYTCSGPPDQQCAITGDEYYIYGCVLYNIIPMYAAMAGLHVFIGAAMAYVLWRNWSYDNPGATPAADGEPVKSAIAASD